MRRAMILFSVVVLGGSLVSAQRSGRQDVALQAAIRTETVDGDLRKAITQYEAIARSGDRVAGASALLRMAECYQKLGDAQARTTYERLVRDFADQTETVATARARLAGSGRETGIVARQLWGTSGYLEITIGPDGHTAAIVDGASSDVVIRDLATHDTTRLNLSDPSGAYPEWPVLSPDARQLAYVWAGPETKWNYQLRVGVPRPGTNGQPLGSDTFGYLSVHGWASDAKSVLVSAIGDGSVTRVGWMSTTDGTFKVLKAFPPRGPGWLSLSRDRRFIAYDIGVEGATDRQIRVLTADGSRESVIIDSPGINSSPVWSGDGAHLVFTSDRSGTFGLWSVGMRDGQRSGSPVLLKPSIGNVTLHGFTSAGTLVYSQATGTRDVYSVGLNPESGTLIGDRVRAVDTFIGSNLNPSQSPDGKSLAYLSIRTGIPASGYVGTLIIRSLETAAERVIATPFRFATKPLWSSDGQTIIELARNATNNDSIYRVDLRSGIVTEVADTGVMAPPEGALSLDGQTVYMQAEGRFIAYNMATGTRSTISDADRGRAIAVSPDGKSIAFVTTKESAGIGYIHVADADGRNARTIMTTAAQEAPPRAIAWDPQGRFIYFARRNELLRIPAAGGPSSLVGELAPIQVTSLEVARDGRRVFYSVGGPPTIEVWTLENLDSASRASR